jgi:hypothetical protein
MRSHRRDSLTENRSPVEEYPLVQGAPPGGYPDPSGPGRQEGGMATSGLTIRSDKVPPIAGPGRSPQYACATIGHDVSQQFCRGRGGGLGSLDHGSRASRSPRDLEEGRQCSRRPMGRTTFGAVLRVEWSWGGDPPMEDHLVSVVQVMKRTPSGWDVSPGDGGGGWFDPPLQRPSLGRHHVQIGGLHMSGTEDWMRTAVWGLVGSDISTVDLLAKDLVISRTVESAMGAIVVAFDSAVPAAIHLSASDGTLVKALSWDTFALT